MTAPVDRLAEENTTLLEGFQQPRSGWNCPAVCGAVARFLDTGQITTARRHMSGFGWINCGTPFQRAGLRAIIREVRGGVHGYHVILGAQGGADQQHYANLVNINGTVHYVDAYTRPPVYATDIAAQVSWANRFEWTPNANWVHVPADGTARCPAPRRSRH